MSKHHGFLFTAPMVRAIMADPMRKTCTRRVVSPYNSLIDGTGKDIRRLWPYLDWKRAEPGDGCFTIGMVKITPRVQPGHWIYVRETWRPVMEGYHSYIEYKADNAELNILDARDSFLKLKSVFHRVPGGKQILGYSKAWHSPLHLRKEWSRAWLPVTKAGAGRMQDTSFADMRLEGVECPEHGILCDGPCSALEHAWANLWNGINGQKPDCSWAADPPVWDFHWEERREKPC